MFKNIAYFMVGLMTSVINDSHIEATIYTGKNCLTLCMFGQFKSFPLEQKQHIIKRLKSHGVTIKEIKTN